MKYFLTIFIVSALFSVSCTKNNSFVRSLYLWKVSQNISEKDTSFFNKNKIDKLYIRFFDVSKEKNEFTPKGILNFTGICPEKQEIIPVIFIENKSLENADFEQIKELATNMRTKMKSLSAQYFPNKIIKELQLDCDWSNKTKDNFFRLIQVTEEENPDKVISVTIRLHQIKYSEKTGVPPADKGVLMYYNMGNFKNPEELNSILNNTTGEQYLKNIEEYPLDLSLALPVFSWSVLFKENEAKGIIYSLNSNTIESNDFLEKTKNNLYKVIKDTVYEDYYLRKGDILRFENSEISEIKKAENLCKKLTKNEIIIFSYSPENSKIIKDDKIDEIFSIKY